MHSRKLPTMLDATAPIDETASFRHEALFYRGEVDFIERVVSFIRRGVEAQAPVLVAVSAERIAMLRDELGSVAGLVTFEDINAVGRNPACIIPLWSEFVLGHANRRKARGVGEPIHAARSRDELVECERHEALLNLAFADGPPWDLLCPYDVESLDPAVLAEAARNHPFVAHHGTTHASPEYQGLERIDAPFRAPLAPPPFDHLAMPFETFGAGAVRKSVADYCATRLPDDRVDDLVLAANELATNSLRHGGGTGVLRLWSTGAAVVCEIEDRGAIADPLAGRRQPRGDQEGGRGLWLANQVCDLVQIRVLPTGGVVRLHVDARGRGSQQLSVEL